MDINITKVNTALLRFVVYPKYSIVEFVCNIDPEFNVHIDHLYIGLGIFGAFLHGIIGKIKDNINVLAAIINEYDNLFFICILYNICLSI